MPVKWQIIKLTMSIYALLNSLQWLCDDACIICSISTLNLKNVWFLEVWMQSTLWMQSPLWMQNLDAEHIKIKLLATLEDVLWNVALSLFFYVTAYVYCTVHIKYRYLNTNTCNFISFRIRFY